MIDAYEIGIKLALQDDVSAGLAVISRELAEVDRGIAATSAALGQLARLTGVTGKAVSTGDARREKQDRGAVPSADVPEQSARDTPAVNDRSPDPAAPVPQAAPAASEPQAAQNGSGAGDAPSAPTIRPDTGQVVSERIVTSPPVVAQAVVAAAVRSSDGSAPSVQAAVASAPPAPAVPEGQGAGPRIESGPISPSTGPRRPDTALRPVAPDRARGTLQVTSSISQRSARDEAGAGSRVVMTGGDPASALPFVMPTPAPFAPRSEVGSQKPGDQAARPVDRAAAPQAAPRDQAESGGGTVMLDGRLVGYWLSEQMARDASRPSSGTTYFDPRQGPSWTASGTV